jgi:hypothetical protein
VERAGLRYEVTKNPKAVVEPTKAAYHLSNLFNGDKVLGKGSAQGSLEPWLACKV